MSYRLREGVTIRELPEGDAVIAGAGSDALIINASAFALLALLSEQRTEDELADVLCETFSGQDRAAVVRDVAALIAELQRAGIVERCGTAPSIA
jgi:hypothetical protein